MAVPTTRPTPFDPPAALAVLRAEEPVAPLRYPDGHVGWLITGYDLARKVLVDSRFSMKPGRSPVGDPVKMAEALQAVTGERGEVTGDLLGLDPPRHTKFRRLQAGYFTVQRSDEHRVGIERIVLDCLDEMERHGSPVDFVETFAAAVPGLATCALLGVPGTDRPRFERPWKIATDPTAAAEEQRAAYDEFRDYAHSVIQQKRAAPGDDLLSDLVRTSDLTDAELADVAILLFSGAQETTESMLALSVLVLLSERDRWEQLCAEPSLIGSTVEELLRYLTILQVGAASRTATEDVDLDGTIVKAGESVTVSLAAANRDPAKFADPDLFDPARDATGHLAFGHGRHMCLGQHLARLEMKVALTALTSRFPTLRLVPPSGDLPLYPAEKALHGVHELLVAW